jgi:hypothetical protein
MQPVRTTTLSLALLPAGTVIAHAGSQGMIKANGIVCITQSGIEAARPDMTVKQLESLRCTNAPTELHVDVIPPSASCDSYLFVAARLPEKIGRYWIRRDELDNYAPQLSDTDVSCRHE